MTMSGSAYIECSGLFKIYKAADLEVVALRGLELTVQQGEILAIVGASGSGKSTLLNILAGYDAPSAGTIRVGDFDLLQMTNKEVVKYRRHEVGFIWQETSRNLFPYLTTLENVELPMVIAGSPKTERKKRAQELLDIVGLGDRSNHKPSELSGGEQQRVAIARALINKPKIILADEPTGNLDSVNSESMIELLFDYTKRSQTSLVIVTHENSIAERCDRIIELRDGQIV